MKLSHERRKISMSDFVKTMKLHIHTDETTDVLFKELTQRYSSTCNEISQYIFDHEFILNYLTLQKQIYYDLREKCGLKSQMTLSALKTVTARYKTVKEQLYSHPYKYKDEDGNYQRITRTLEWLMKPIFFGRPQADLVRNRDYSFINNGTQISINTLKNRVKVTFERPKCFDEYFSGDWSFGTAKLVCLKKKWYLHIPMTKSVENSMDTTKPAHVVGIDRGLRFLATTYDEQGKCSFQSGEKILRKRDKFATVRAELQSKGTKSAKRKLKALSGRENRWIADVNHQLSKALVQNYGEHTLFVLEDLTNVSFEDTNLNKRNKKQKNQLRSWSFYQFEQMLTYKAAEVNSAVLKVPANYTSQRCPKCGRIHKENRHHETHNYVCDACGYESNDDRIGAMNLYTLGTMYVSGDSNPRFGIRKIN